MSKWNYEMAASSKHVGKAKFTIEDIFNAIVEDEPNKKDISIHPSNVTVDAATGLIVMNDYHKNEVDVFDLNPWSLTQWCGKMNGLTPKYWNECPNWLKAANGNHWLAEMVTGLNEKNAKLKSEPSPDKGKMLFRIREGGVDTEGNELGNVIRGIMSDKYSKFDDIKLVEMLMTIMEDKKYNFETTKIVGYTRNDLGFSLRILIDEPIEIGRTKLSTSHHERGDIHYRGILIENSEVGRKSIKIKPFIWRQVCTNGLVAYKFNSDDIMKQRHIGVTDEGMLEVVAEMMGKAFEASKETIERLKKAKDMPKLEKEEAYTIIERFSKECKYDKKFVEAVKKQFIEDPKSPRNVFGIVQAFTEAVQGGENVDKKNLRYFNGYSNADDRTRVETDAAMLLDRLTA